jgi:hypothetical protein
MNDKQFKVEHILYILAFALALLLRLVNLGSIPLSEFEAGWAMQALAVSKGAAVSIGANPAYVLVTGLVFTIFGSSEALARILPALLGSVLVWAPFAFREQLGKRAALVVAFGLAFDPGLTAVSRLAGGPGFSVAFVLLALAFWKSKNATWAGVFAALSLLSGPSALLGWLGLGLALGLSAAIKKQSLGLPKENIRPALIACGVTLLLAGTLFLRYPQGLSAFGASIPDFFGGFFRRSTISLGEMLVALPVYQPLALGFGLFFLFRISKEENPFNDLLKTWFWVSLALALLYASRQVYDLIWAIIPLWALAGQEIGRMVFDKDRRSVVSWGQMLLTVVLLALFWLNLTSISGPKPPQYQELVELLKQYQFGQIADLDQLTRTYFAHQVFVVLVPVLAFAAAVLVGLGWSLEEALGGFVWGAALFLAAYTFGAAVGVGQVPARVPNELWYPGMAPGNIALLQETIADLSEQNLGTRTGIEVVYQVDSASLAWVLRNFPNARYLPQLGPGELPAIVITGSVANDPFLETAYRGQSLSIRERRAWEGSMPPEFIPWMVYRQSPTFSDPVILWARADLFPEGSILPSPGLLPDTGNNPGADDLIPERDAP